MMKVIRRYYLGLFIGSFLVMLLGTFTMKSPNSIWVNITICLTGALIISVACGTIYYLQDTRWGPATRQRRLLKSPFKELFENGFTREEDVAVGMLNGYTVIVIYTWSDGKPAIRADVLFDIGPISEEAAKDYIEQLRKRNKPANRWKDPPFEWSRNSVGTSLQYTFKPPAYEKLMKKAGELVGIVVRERLAPMSLQAARRLAAVGEASG